MSAPGPERGDGDGDVLSNLPRSRPHRRSSKRPGPAAAARTAGHAAEASSTAAGTPRPADAVKAARKPAAKAKVAKPAAAKPAATKPATASTPTAAARERAAQRLRTAPRPPAPLPPRAGETEPPKREPAPSGAELVGTVVQAAGELAQVGLTIGGQVLKRAVSRLPKP